MSKLKVVIADDHAILRAGLRLLINSQQDMEVVADVPDVTTAAQEIAANACDVLILDYSIPGVNTCRAIEAMRRNVPQTRILALSEHDDAAAVAAVMTAGAAGYVLKQSNDSELLAAIRSICRGESFIDSSVANAVIRQSVLKRTAVHSAEPGKVRHVLSRRERQVLELVAEGFTNQEVADRLFLSIKTVETHRSRLMRKLGLHSRADLMRYAREAGVQARNESPPIGPTPDQDQP
jgi:DNA-binding NarL/FixJ family response regulator